MIWVLVSIKTKITLLRNEQTAGVFILHSEQIIQITSHNVKRGEFATQVFPLLNFKKMSV